MFNFRKSLSNRLCSVAACDYKDLDAPFAGLALRAKFALRKRLARTHPNFILGQSTLTRINDKHEYHIDFIGNDIYTVLTILCIDLAGFNTSPWLAGQLWVGPVAGNFRLSVRSLTLYV